ncbi:alanyl-tRNA editing protein [Candidatus Woesearchaeota archaeon]|nr:alanyl-tRNA editing protein [Candidatus Woesearchaeota archaeon]
MVEALYLLDCYLKEFEASVVSVKDDKFVVLDRTAFYPQSGGQPFDTGKMVKEDGSEHGVVFVGKFSGEISHEVSGPGLMAGDKVKCAIDWDRRYKHMRMHTAAHVLSNVIEKDAGALITGNQLGLDQSRIDFSLEDFDREKFKVYEEHANRIVEEGHNVNLFLMSRDEAEKRAERLSGLAKGLPPEIKDVRLVEIENFTVEACGGTHLSNTSEIKGIRITKMENKGAKNRRAYFELVE